jgi:hypothetical protein
MRTISVNGSGCAARAARASVGEQKTNLPFLGRMVRSWPQQEDCMTALSHGLALQRGPQHERVGRNANALDTVQDALGTLVARYRFDEVLTALRHIPAREAQFRPMSPWVNCELAAAYRAKGIEQLYSHQQAAAELAHVGKNVVVVTPTASGKTL